MLRINLLPAYIAERRKIRATIAGFAAGLAATLLILGAWFFSLQNQTTTREAEANEQERLAQEVTAIGEEAQRIRSGVQPLLDDVNFVNSVLFYNRLRPNIFRRAAAYTYRNVEYNDMSVNGQTLSIRAFARNVSDVGRFLITMFSNPDLQAVSVSGIPGWPPRADGANAGAGGADVPGGGFGGGDVPGFAAEGGSPTGFPGAGGTGDVPGFPGAGGAGDVPGFPGAGGGDLSGGFGGGSAFGGGQRVAPRRGFPFVVTARLVQPVAAPRLPGTTPQPGQGGFGPGASPEGDIPPGEAPPPDAPSPTANPDGP